MGRKGGAGGRGERREMRPIGFQQDVGVEARTERWKEFCGIKRRIN